MERIGEAGMEGTKFVAHVVVRTPQEVLHLKPYIEVTSRGPQFQPVRVGEDYLLYLQRMDAKDYSATLQFFFIRPVFPLEVFFKPMTVLVWIGMGVMTIGGFWTLFYRGRKGVVKPIFQEVPTLMPQSSELVGSRG
jgi:cytochrome c-type biogenesis protein CcmF